MIREIMMCFIEQLLSITTFSIILFLTTVRVEKKKNSRISKIYTQVRQINIFFIHLKLFICLFFWGGTNSTKNAAELCVCIIYFICLTQPYIKHGK